MRPQEPVEGGAQAAGPRGSGGRGLQHAAGVAAVAGEEGEQEHARGDPERARGKDAEFAQRQIARGGAYVFVEAGEPEAGEPVKPIGVMGGDPLHAGNATIGVRNRFITSSAMSSVCTATETRR